MTHEDAIKWLGNLRNDLGNPHYECLWPYAQAIDEICELLKEQEPMLVLSRRECETLPNHYERKGFCPKCHQVVEWFLNRSYCGFCGKAVKWDD